MAHKWTFWIALWGFLCVGGLECAILSEGTDTLSTVCANVSHVVSCGNNTAIAITGLAHGYKGATINCNDTGSCCTYNSTTDCLEVAPNDATLMDRMSGRSYAGVSIGDAIANTNCTLGYATISTFNRMNYQCIKESRIKEMCVPSRYRSEDGLPVYIQNRDYRSGTSILDVDTSCSVSVEVLSRSTNTQLHILHMQLSSNSSCQQSITVSNGNNVVKTFDCDPAPFNQIKSETLFGNYFLFNLTNTKTETGGKFWIGVEGVSGNPPIVIVSPAVPRINCGDLNSPVNGTVDTTDTNYGSVANYTCTSGYDVTFGNISRICQENGTWSGTAVVCSYKCGPLENPENGLVFYNATTATYICNSSFELKGTQTRNCVSGSGWNGSEPTCSATSNTQPSNEDAKGIGTTTLLVIAFVLGVAVALLVAIIICYCNKKRYRKTHPEKEAQETPQDQTRERQFTKQEETKLEVDHETPKGKKKKRKRKIKHQRPTELEAMETPQEQNGTMEPESKHRHDISMDPKEPPPIELKPNEPMEKEEEQLLYSSMFPMDPPRVEKRPEPIMHPTTSNATETDTHLRHRRLLDEECHDIAFHPHGELNEKKKKKKKKRRVHESLETTLDQDHIHTVHMDHQLHGPARVHATSEFSDHNCHDYVYHPHGALSHRTREEESKLGLPHETTETKRKKKRKKKKKKAKHQEQDLFDESQCLPTSGYHSDVITA